MALIEINVQEASRRYGTAGERANEVMAHLHEYLRVSAWLEAAGAPMSGPQKLAALQQHNGLVAAWESANAACDEIEAATEAL